MRKAVWSFFFFFSSLSAFSFLGFIIFSLKIIVTVGNLLQLKIATFTIIMSTKIFCLIFSANDFLVEISEVTNFTEQIINHKMNIEVIHTLTM